MDIKISIDGVKKGFNDFLGIEGNSRFLFSGKFGTGKTHFLNEFFQEKKDLYDVFHLYPVNYQVNNNEDIASLLKYDILVELIKKNNDIFTGKSVNGIKEQYLLFWSWFKEKNTLNSLLQKVVASGENLTPFSADLLSNVLLKLGRPLKDLLEIDKEFQEFKEEYKAGEKGLVKKYIDEIKNKNISEPDYISNLVKEKIFEQKGIKKSVLILDDLDRIDPEHIFRLLNLLASFFERENENRFGFDIIIVVADHSNLKHIFHHKYGAETDFSGYIDKFFTIIPYYFDNKKAVISTVDHIVKNIKNENPELRDAIGESGYIKLFLEHIFVRAVETENINLRELLKPTKFQFTELKKDGFYDSSYRRDHFKRLFDISIRVAILSFSNANQFLKCIKSMKESSRRTSERMPFKIYITSIINSLELNKGNEQVFYWKEYQIGLDVSYNSFSGVSNGTTEDLFYDLLTEYVRSSSYLIQ